MELGLLERYSESMCCLNVTSMHFEIEIKKVYKCACENLEEIMSRT